MHRFSCPARLMIVSDLDHTMVDHHDPENISLLRFNALWESQYRHDSLLVFSTGRSPTLYKELRNEKPMLTDITIMSVGTEITYGDTMSPDHGWEGVLNQKWDRKVVLEESAKFPQLKLQKEKGKLKENFMTVVSLIFFQNFVLMRPETEQQVHKVSYYVEKAHAQDVIASLSNTLEEKGLDVKIIYSGGIDLDILPQAAGKGQALAYLLRKFKADGRPPVNTLVCGDSGNDAELFSIPGVYGVMVKNSQDELLQWYEKNARDNNKIIHAKERCAGGIIQAIGHFGLGPDKPLRDVTDLLTCTSETTKPAFEIVKLYLIYERWRRAEVDKSDSLMQHLKAMSHPTGIVVHPSGVEYSLHECLGTLTKCYGDKQGKPFRVWIDRVVTSQFGPESWLVKFDKWEQTEKGKHCCLTTVLLHTKPENPGGPKLVHVHQT